MYCDRSEDHQTEETNWGGDEKRKKPTGKK
jgi:hypothetical protein